MLILDGVETTDGPKLVNPDIDGGTIDDATISGSSLSGSYQTVKGTTGGWKRQFAEADADITANHTITISTQVPEGARLLGCQLRVDEALAAGETWNAQYVTGATATIATNQAVAANTKASAAFDTNAATDITSGATDVTIQRNSNPGVDAFTAQGNIRAIVYYDAFVAMGDA